MFKSSKRIETLNVEEEQARKPASMAYEMNNCLKTTSKEEIKPLHVEVKKKEELPYVDLDLDLDLDFSKENLVKAMIYSEILGKPKSKRRKQG